MKTCTKCGCTKPQTEFCKYHKSPDGLNWHCKSCASKASTKYKRLQATGCTPEMYDSLYTKQSGCCAICGKHNSKLKRNLAADHCHDSNKIRGLLCGRCNRGLGYFKDNPDLLFQAISYLKRSQ